MHWSRVKSQAGSSKTSSGSVSLPSFILKASPVTRATRSCWLRAKHYDGLLDLEMRDNEKVAAIIAAGGSSQRMGEIDKLFAPLDGKPLLSRVVEVFQRSSLIDQVVLVLSQQNLEAGKRLVEEQQLTKVTDVCPGGKRRQDSVAVGLDRISPCDWVIIHDGARPLVTGDLVERGLEAARETGAAIAAVPVTETIKVITIPSAWGCYGSYRYAIAIKNNNHSSTKHTLIKITFNIYLIPIRASRASGLASSAGSAISFH